MTSLGFSHIGRRAAVVASAVAIVSTTACSDEATAPRSAAAPAAANLGVAGSGAIVMPRIDGTITSSEWDGAALIPLQVPLPNGTTQQGNALFMHDRQYLYMAVVFDRKSPFHANDVVGFEFDNDNDGIAENGDDLAFMSPGSPQNVQVPGGDFYRYNSGASSKGDVADGGTNELVVSWGTMFGTFGVFEMRKPLNSSDNAHDFSIPLSLAPWTLGVKVRVSLESDPVGSNTYVHLAKPGWTSYCKLTIHPTLSTAVCP